ncbi:MAG TPA: SpoIID/LytB domain-containing protein [Desulfotomaculum sp.]|nr:SpoIID/LytB domain-containing protein [Desulfotomaculum sp.]
MLIRGKIRFVILVCLLLGLAGAIILLLPKAAGASTKTGGTPDAVVVSKPVVNLRGGPGTGYALMGQVLRGTRLAVVGKSGDWYKVRLSGGRTVWIAGWLVKAAAPEPDGSLSRGPDAGPAGEPELAPFSARTFSAPIRAALCLNALAAAFSVYGDYAVIDGSSGRILSRPGAGDVFTVTARKTPGAAVGQHVYVIQLDRNRVFSGSYTGPVVLTEGEAATGNSFRLTVNGISRHYRGNLTIRLNEGRLLLVNELPLEEYLYGVVPCEMPPLWPAEALKAQAVAARSYALYAIKYGGGVFYDVLATQASQVYRGLDAECTATTDAVDQTRGLVLVKNDRIVPAYFHSSDGGYTEDSEDVWRAYVSSIRGKPDPYDRHPENPHYDWSIRYSVYELAAHLSLKEYPLSVVTEIYEIEKTRVGSKTKKVRVRGLDESGQRQEYLLGNADLVRVAFRLKAPPVYMKKEYDEETGALTAVTFTGSGWGHGLGMSQWGARTMAEKGLDYSDILNFYYAGVKIKAHL